MIELKVDCERRGVYASASVCGEYVIVRGDDTGNPEWWVEVILSRESLEAIRRGHGIGRVFSHDDQPGRDVQVRGRGKPRCMVAGDRQWASVAVVNGLDPDFIAVIDLTGRVDELLALCAAESGVINE